MYQKVILAYDTDLDERLRLMVDLVPPYFRYNLQVVHECDGSLTMIWKDEVPECYLEGNSIGVPYADGQVDFWHITDSVTSQKIIEEYKNKRREQFLFSLN